MPAGTAIRPWRTWLPDKDFQHQNALEKHREGVIKVDRLMTIQEREEVEDGTGKTKP